MHGRREIGTFRFVPFIEVLTEIHYIGNSCIRICRSRTWFLSFEDRVFVVREPGFCRSRTWFLSFEAGFCQSRAWFLSVDDLVSIVRGPSYLPSIVRCVS